MIGPIQLLAVRFDSIDNFKGEIIAELSDLIGRGVIRLVDLQFIQKNADGSVIAIQDSSLKAEESEEFGGVLKLLLGLEGDEEFTAADAISLAEESFGIGLSDLTELKDALEPGTAVGILLFEHTWASGFKQAMRDAGAVPVMQGFLTLEAVNMVGSEIQAIVDAERAIAVADTIKTAALLDALRTVVDAEIIQQAAIEETVEVVQAARMVQSAVAADVVRTLIIAGLIEDAATNEAIDALYTAGLIEEMALAQAEAAVAAMEAEVDAARAEIEAGMDSAEA